MFWVLIPVQAIWKLQNPQSITLVKKEKIEGNTKQQQQQRGLKAWWDCFKQYWKQINTSNDLFSPRHNLQVIKWGNDAFQSSKHAAKTKG